MTTPDPTARNGHRQDGGGYLLAQGDARRLPLPDKSVALVFGSPPYCDARTYGIGAQRDARAWVDWMLAVTTEAVRVSRGLVLWVCAGVTRDHCYWPACEGLLWRWWETGGQCWRPAFWHRVGIPGSGGKKWLRADVEYVLCFKGPSNDFWTDNTACGHTPKYAPGGEMSYRMTNGDRCNRDQWGGTPQSTGSRRADGGRKERGRPSHIKALVQPNGSREEQSYAPPVLANPGNLIKTKAGGGHLGNDLAHENEAPFPEALAEFFVLSFCPPGEPLLDPFSGSATTCAVAERHGRIGLGFDLRRSQCELGLRRIPDSLRVESRLDAKVAKPLPGQLDLFATLEAS